MTTDIVWLVGRYAFLGLLYLFVLLVLRTLIAEMRTEAAPVRPAPREIPVAPPRDPQDTGSLDAATPQPAPPAYEPLPPRLVVVESPDLDNLPVGTTFNLTAVTTIGRGTHNSVALPADKFASTNHALVFVRDGVVLLRDRGATNGTLINGQRAEGEMALRDGDRVTVGTTVLRFADGDASVAANAPQDVT